MVVVTQKNIYFDSSLFSLSSYIALGIRTTKINKYISTVKTDASLSEDMSRTGTPQNIHGDSDSDGGNDGRHHSTSLQHHLHQHARRAAAAAAEHHRHHLPPHLPGTGNNAPVMSGAIHSALAASAAAAAGGLLSSVHPSTVSLGPPLPPPPHLLPYLYPGAGLYPGGPSLHQLSQLLHHHHPPGMMNAAAAHMGHMGHNLLLNAQLALAAQHQLFHPYQNLSAATLAAAAAASSASTAPPPPPTLPPTSARGHRFAPYSLAGSSSPKSTSSAISAFETVSPKTSPPQRHSSPTGTPNNSHPSSPVGNPIIKSSPASDLKNIEKMVNGLDSSVAESSIGSPPDVKPVLIDSK